MRRVARRAGSWRCWGAEGKFAGPPTPFEFRGNLRVTGPETEKARAREKSRKKKVFRVQINSKVLRRRELTLIRREPFFREF